LWLLDYRDHVNVPDGKTVVVNVKLLQRHRMAAGEYFLPITRGDDSQPKSKKYP